MALADITGPAGDDGDPGDPGAPGDDGDPGAPGSQFHAGAGAPKLGPWGKRRLVLRHRGQGGAQQGRRRLGEWCLGEGRRRRRRLQWCDDLLRQRRAVERPRSRWRCLHRRGGHGLLRAEGGGNLAGCKAAETPPVSVVSSLPGSPDAGTFYVIAGRAMADLDLSARCASLLRGDRSAGALPSCETPLGRSPRPTSALPVGHLRRLGRCWVRTTR